LSNPIFDDFAKYMELDSHLKLTTYLNIFLTDNSIEKYMNENASNISVKEKNELVNILQNLIPSNICTFSH
jgi:hypothetical protein